MLTIAFLILLSVNATGAFAQEAHLVVEVVNALGFPLPGARVEVSLEANGTAVASALTDAFGSARIRVTPSRTYVVRAAHEGFLAADPKQLIPTPGDTATYFQLVDDEGMPPIDPGSFYVPPPPKGVLSGRILSAERQPLAGIRVEALDRSNWVHPSPARTRADGSYGLAVPPGVYSVAPAGI